ncbi:hypothetical protein ABQZ69_09640 [Xanthomonas sp. WHRI 8391]|uniref:Uncharacterized protein n=1 Tax=Xanthomonas hortorum pv. carotae TaxID=487904 RepID=A0A6V7FMT0_9XANT|nr:hypothetical protein [Xanthomonas hortorum]ETC85427.1 hypothetical protein XHC_3953 [Xanthomonas hortorum pv. carotae str. M081]MBG3851905.1 hypothetical protein [Xanthomonas hortorum pv. carotae]UTS74625.1 hypothetical protein NMB96_07450 [Xanthomonas hortorum]CAD0364302.1 hypothetical protein CFBP7900_41720 [Xanthomonas hortorum pv. carotae]CAD0364305.1 hypothetical protein CFBP7900_41720 [Xanthomonas hortorum pv. carotae]
MRKGSASRKLVIATVVVLAVAAICVAWLRWHRLDQVVGANPVRAPSAVTLGRQAKPGVASAPLPPADVPLRQVFNELSRRAEKGDPAAACRLASELDRCDGIQQQLATYDELAWRAQRARERKVVTPNEGANADAWNKMLDGMAMGLVKAADRCEGIRQVSVAERVALWRQGALGGNPGALAHYAVGNAFRRRDMLELLPELQRYRKEAESMALQAASRGDLQTSLALAAAYSPRRDTGERFFLAQVVKPDLARSLALYRRGSQQLPATAGLRSREVIDDNIAWLRQHATASDLARADVLGNEWARKWSAAPSATLAGMTVNDDGGVGDIQPAQCAQ